MTCSPATRSLVGHHTSYSFLPPPTLSTHVLCVRDVGLIDEDAQGNINGSHGVDMGNEDDQHQRSSNPDTVNFGSKDSVANASDSTGDDGGDGSKRALDDHDHEPDVDSRHTAQPIDPSLLLAEKNSSLDDLLTQTHVQGGSDVDSNGRVGDGIPHECEGFPCAVCGAQGPGQNDADSTNGHAELDDNAHVDHGHGRGSLNSEDDCDDHDDYDPNAIKVRRGSKSSQGDGHDQDDDNSTDKPDNHSKRTATSVRFHSPPWLFSGSLRHEGTHNDDDLIMSHTYVGLCRVLYRRRPRRRIFARACQAGRQCQWRFLCSTRLRSSASLSATSTWVCSVMIRLSTGSVSSAFFPRKSRSSTRGCLIYLRQQRARSLQLRCEPPPPPPCDTNAVYTLFTCLTHSTPFCRIPFCTHCELLDFFLSLSQTARGLQAINSNLITSTQNDYVMGILNLILECQPVQPALVKFGLFCLMAALSERIVALDPVVAKCLNKMDFSALRTKLMKARDMFFCNDPTGSVSQPPQPSLKSLGGCPLYL